MSEAVRTAGWPSGMFRDGNGRFYWRVDGDGPLLHLDADTPEQVYDAMYDLVQLSMRGDCDDDIRNMSEHLRRLVRGGMVVAVMAQYAYRPRAFYDLRRDAMTEMRRVGDTYPEVVRLEGRRQIDQAFARVFGSDGDGGRYVFADEPTRPADPHAPGAVRGPDRVANIPGRPRGPRPPPSFRSSLEDVFAVCVRLEALYKQD